MPLYSPRSEKGRGTVGRHKPDLPQGTMDLLVLKALSLGRERVGHLVEQPPARFYRLTRQGRRRLASEESKWEHLTAAVAKVLQAT